MKLSSRTEQFKELFPSAPSFRLRQMEEALFSESFDGFQSISSMPLAMREVAEKELPWMSVSPVRVLESASGDTYKAVVETVDQKRIETVLMKNARGHFTVCVSSQVGCAMACTFCATGTMGLVRNLSSDEIIDQYRFWIAFLKGRSELPQYISNIVFMGMGEPLANYANVKEALRLILKYTDIGPTRITVSTVGLLPMLRHLLSDPEWPPVRLAVSLHSADSDTRKRMMPSSFDGFLDDLAAWADEYFKKFESKRRHLTFEYVMLAGVNDTAMHAEALIRFARRIGKVRINLIPYNFTGDVYSGSLPGDFAGFEKKLSDAGVDATRRRSMGDDIAAACGQLVTEKTKA
jgi:adenine C2-methylase RlmN of 23S rRNA A2503 and tRNA A37